MCGLRIGVREMTRSRFIYSKRHGACFVPHIALAQIFSRTARRAGLELEMTQGFSPRAKISFGPELPAGVIALNEPVDMFFKNLSPDINHDMIAAMNHALPDGFRISRVMFPEEGSPSIGKLCTHAEYFLRLRNSSLDRDALMKAASEFYHDAVIKSGIHDDWTRIILTEPAQHPIGGLVKHMMGENIITGWHEINIVRASIGKYSPEIDSVMLNG